MSTPKYHRKIIHLSAEDSPNVQVGKARVAAGLPPGAPPVPGVLSYDEYMVRRATWDKVRQCIGLDGKFWEGAEQLLFPPPWLDHAAEYEALRPARQLRAWLGVDTGEGGDETVWSVVDKYGLLYEEGAKTGDTTRIPVRTLEIMRANNVAATDVAFDRGGGGIYAAQVLRAQGHNVRTLPFNAKVGYMQDEDFPDEQRTQDVDEFKFSYFNRRVQLYCELSTLVDPARPLDHAAVQGDHARPRSDNVATSAGRLVDVAPFCIPARYIELRRQLAPIPRRLKEGRTWLPPKHKTGKSGDEETLTSLIGGSPDRADALALAVHLMIGAHVPGRPWVVVGSGAPRHEAVPPDGHVDGFPTHFRRSVGDKTYIDVPPREHANGTNGTNGKHGPPRGGLR